MGRDNEVADQTLGPKIRWLLMACGPMSLGGVATFAPPFPHIRNMVGLPEVHPLYLWVLTARSGIKHTTAVCSPGRLRPLAADPGRR